MYVKDIDMYNFINTLTCSVSVFFWPRNRLSRERMTALADAKCQSLYKRCAPKC